MAEFVCDISDEDLLGKRIRILAPAFIEGVVRGGPGCRPKRGAAVHVKLDDGNQICIKRSEVVAVEKS